MTTAALLGEDIEWLDIATDFDGPVGATQGLNPSPFVLARREAFAANGIELTTEEEAEITRVWGPALHQAANAAMGVPVARVLGRN